MKFLVDIPNFRKMFDGDDENASMYMLIDDYLRKYHDADISLYATALKHALFKMVKNIDRSKLAIDIFVEKPRFTIDCPASLVKPEYHGFFIDSDGDFSSRHFFMLLELAGCTECTIKCDKNGHSKAKYKNDDNTTE